MKAIALNLTRREYNLILEALVSCEAELLLKSGKLMRAGNLAMAQHYADKREAIEGLIRWKFDADDKEEKDDN